MSQANLGADRDATGPLGAGQVPDRGAARTWARHVAPAYLGHLVAAVAVTVAIGARSVPLLLLTAAVLAVATVVLEAALTRQRTRQRTSASLLRAGVGLVQLAIGLTLLLWVRSEAGDFLGLVAILLFLSTVRAEYRVHELGKHVRGPVLLGVGALLIVLGLAPIGAIDAIAGVALVGFGAVVALMGVELHTEDWSRRAEPWSARAMRSRAGWYLVAAVLVWFLLVGVTAAVVGVLVLVLVLVVAAVLLAASDSDGAEIAVLLTIALVWAVAPRDVTPGAALEPRPGEPYFVALGDSFISGEGAKRYVEGTNDRRGDAAGATECRRAPTAHPVVLAEQQVPGLPERVLFLACSGALAVDLHGDRPGRTEPVSQLDQLAAAADGDGIDPADLAFVLLSVGGNDAGFGEIGLSCVGPGDCTEVAARWLDRLDHVRRELDTAYAAVAAAVDAPVLVVPYPVPLAGHECWWSTLTAREAAFITGFVERLNAVVASVAAEHGFDVIETVETALGTERLRVCDPTWPWQAGMNFIGLNPTSGELTDVVNPRNWLNNSLHPNGDGHAAISRAVQAWLTDPAPPRRGAPRDLPDPPVTRCDADDPPEPCSQRTAEWQGAQLLAQVRAAALPAALAAMAAWLLVAPRIRSRAERGALGPGRWILEALERLATARRGA